LLAAAEKLFDAFITTDQNLCYQQNLTGRRLAIMVFANHQLAENSKTHGQHCGRCERAQAGRFYRVQFLKGSITFHARDSRRAWR